MTVSRLVGGLVGAALVAAGILGIVFLRGGKAPAEEPPVIRPVKTIVVGSPSDRPPRRYPGRVQANQRVIMTFLLPGRLIELPVKKGDLVEKGQLLARLDPRDYQSRLNTQEALLQQRELDVKRYKEAFEKKVATSKEVDDAVAKRDMAKAQRDIAAKAVEDTQLRAPFAGLVADRFVENHQDVMARENILSLQEIEDVEVVVNIPERHIAEIRGHEDQVDLAATFDFLPGREFPVTIDEYATEADPATQTFAVTVTMPSPKGVRILPGMTSTIVERVKSSRPDQGYYLPISIVPVDEAGRYYVWKVTPVAGKDGLYTVARQNVTVGPVREADILVTQGVKKGDRLAAAGVQFLKDGEQVTLFVPRGETASMATSTAPAGVPTTQGAGR